MKLNNIHKKTFSYHNIANNMKIGVNKIKNVIKNPYVKLGALATTLACSDLISKNIAMKTLEKIESSDFTKKTGFGLKYWYNHSPEFAPPETFFGGQIQYYLAKNNAWRIISPLFILLAIKSMHSYIKNHNNAVKDEDSFQNKFSPYFLMLVGVGAFTQGILPVDFLCFTINDELGMMNLMDIYAYSAISTIIIQRSCKTIIKIPKFIKNSFTDLKNDFKGFIDFFNS